MSLSKFAKDCRVGYFPSVSVGWNVQEEPSFFPKEAISKLKLRASYGELVLTSSIHTAFDDMAPVQFHSHSMASAIPAAVQLI